jgi:hypothetical protein
MLPALKPSYISKAPDDAEESTESQTESGPAETTEETEAAPETEAVVPEAGHVDNVGDESESETVT